MNLEEASDNISYRGFVIERIHKSLHDGKWRVKFSNGIEIIERERAADFTGLFRQQIQWLIRRHFQKKLGLNERREKVRPGLPERGIKPISLIFIDRVDNYVKDDGIIKTLFREEYASVHREFHGVDPTTDQITAAQVSRARLCPHPRHRTGRNASFPKFRFPDPVPELYMFS